MDPLKLITQGIPLQIEIAPDDYRLIAALTQHPDGWIFADIGWCDPLCSFHPFHLIEGELKHISGTTWDLGGYIIRQVQKSDPSWQEYARENGCTPEHAERRMRISFGLEREYTDAEMWVFLNDAMLSTASA